MKFPGMLFLLGLISYYAGLCSCKESCDVHSQFDWEKVKQCKRLYDALEDALVEENNLYILRESFFSTTQHSNDVLFVSYFIIANKSNNSTGNSTGYISFRGYSKFSIFRIVSPVMFKTLQSEIFWILSKQLYIIPGIIMLRLYVENNTLQEGYIEHITEILDFITPRLKKYASAQGKLTTELSNDDSGYVCRIATYNPFLAVETILSVVFALYLLNHLLKQLSKQDVGSKQIDVKLAIFYSCGMISTLWNIFELCFNFKNAVEYPQSFYDLRTGILSILITDNEQILHIFTKEFLIILGLVVMVTGGIIGCRTAKSLPKPRKFVVFKYLNFCSCFHKKRMFYSFYYANSFYFIYNMSLNILPTLILIFIYPLKMISSLCLIFSLIFMGVCLPIYQMLADIEHGISTTKGKWKQFIKKGFFFCLVCFFFVCIMMVYREAQIVSTSESTNISGFIQAVIPFLSAVCAAGLGYATKRKLNNHNRRSDTQSGINEDETRSSAEHELQEVQDVHLLEEDRTVVEIEGTQL